MMNNYDEIKSLLKASRMILGNINETQNRDILRKHNLLTEQEVEDVIVPDNIQGKIDQSDNKDSDEIGKASDKQKGYKIQGNTIILHGTEETEIELTTDEKNAFVESIDEFRNEVAELVEFGKMNVFVDNVEWNGKISELNLEFFYTINEPNGVYVNGDMIKLDQDYVNTINKLQSNYEKFKTKWSKIVASRQQS
jgi:hypothetical protein